MSMKKVVRCKDCRKCLEYWGVGFTTEVQCYICSRDGEDVDLDDGCTKGEKGSRGTAISCTYDIDISDRAAVEGTRELYSEESRKD